MAANQDYAALDWVKGEIDSTLKQAQQALEGFVNDREDTTKMRFCLTYLHQVHGTLQIVEFYGAALLAEEMERLAQALLAEQISAEDNSLEVLMQAIIQMPAYLDRVKASKRDLPVIILPLLNDIRTVRGEKPLTESALFSPDLEEPTASDQEQAESPTHNIPDLPALLKKIRQLFQFALVGIVRNKDLKTNLQYMLKVLTRLEKLSGSGKLRALWWVAGALVEGLSQEAIKLTPAVKMLLGRLDKHIKSVVEQGELSDEQCPSGGLLKEFLYEIGQSQADTPRVRLVREQYKLDEYIVSKEVIERERGLLKGSNSGAIGSAVKAVIGELGYIKEMLDRFVDEEETNLEELENLLPTFKRVADSLRVMELTQQSLTVISQIKAIKEIICNGVMPGDNTLMDVAGALLYLEANLIGLSEDASARELSADGDVSADSVAPATVEKAQVAVLREVRTELEAAKSSIIEFIASQWNRKHLEQTPDLLDRVMGGLNILNLDLACGVIDACYRFISKRLLNTHQAPSWKDMDTLADAITSVEYFLERLADSGIQELEILGVAEDSVEALGFPIVEAGRRRQPEAELNSDPGDLELPEIPIADEVVDSSAVEVDQVPEIPTVSDEGDAVEVVDESTPQAQPAQAQSTQTQPAEEETLEQPDNALADEPELEEDELIDEEVVEIFVEEAGEVLEVIEEFFPQWKANQSDEKALGEVRRAFHTLKGSGRMVGAKVIGELAWSIENLLNRMMESAIPTPPTVSQLIDTVVELTPGLVEHFNARTKPSVRTQPIEAYAHQLANGDFDGDFQEVLQAAGLVAVELDETPAEPQTIETEDLDNSEHAELTGDEGHSSMQLDAADELEALEEVDPVLIGIFINEAAVHLDEISAYLVEHAPIELSENRVTPIDASLLRALHTLKGSAHMANIEPIACLSTPTEHFVKELHSYHMNLSGEDVDLLNQFVDASRQVLAALSEDVSLDTIEKIPALLQRLEEHLSKVASTLEQQPIPESTMYVDRERVKSFLESGVDLIVDAEHILTEWQKNPIPNESLGALKSELEELASNAIEAQLPGVQQLCELLGKCYLSIINKELVPSDTFFELAHDAHKELITIIDELAAGQPYHHTPSEIIQKIEALLESSEQEVGQQEVANEVGYSADSDSDYEVDKGVDAIERVDALEDERVEPEPIELPESRELEEKPAVVSAQPELALERFDLDVESEDYSPDLLEIFLEEATDLIEAASSLIDHWLNRTDDISYVQELQRNLHTLKGGARMSEVSPVGNLAHHLENIYEGICEHRYQYSDPLKQLLLSCHDRLSAMTDMLQDENGCYHANDLLAELESYQQNAKTYQFGVASGSVDASDSSVEGSAENRAEDMAASSQPSKDDLPKDAALQEMAESLQEVENASEASSANEPLAVESGEAAATTTPSSPEAPPLNQTVKQRLLALLGTIDEDIDSEMIDVFLEEAEELNANLENAINEWRKDLSNKDYNAEIQRYLHTVKGGARIAGLKNLGDMSHHFEHYLIEAANSGSDESPEFAQQIIDRFDGMVKHVEQVKEMLAKFAEQGEEDQSEVPIETPDTLAKRDQAKEQLLQAKEQDLAAEKRRSAQESIKVPSMLMESLVNLAGETSIARGRVEQEVNDFSFTLDEMAATIVRLRDLLRRLDLETEAQILSTYEQEGREYDADFDPLEMDRYSALNQLSRSLGESASDLMDLKSTMMDKVRDTETLLTQQARINTELQEGLMKTRMVPFSRLTPRLRRIVRQISTELGKEAELEVVNAEGELDRSILERMVSPLEHMLRNAVDHGLEMPDKRLAADKPKKGRITLHFAREGGEVVLRLSDDGAGINLERVRSKAVEKGMMAPDAPLSDNEILQFIFKSGFSTASSVTQISGRGVGMDVVYSEIKQMGGTMKIHSAPGIGSQFTIRLPFTVSVNRALMVKVGEDAYAIPLTHIEGIVRITPDQLQQIYQRNDKFNYAGQEYNVQYLGSYVHGITTPNLVGLQRPLPVMLVRGGEQSIALQVDSLIGSREIVVKSVGPQLSSVSGISGATILGDGSVVIILDLVALMRAARAEEGERVQEATKGLEQGQQSRAPMERKRSTPLVMVVDDSVTVRKVTTRLLERHGMDVITAKDGVDAMSILHETKPDVMLLDIEMPRMDGFEVATQVRHDQRLSDLPIIMITSRGGEKHKNRAYEIGVNKYMGKPFQENQLLMNISELMPEDMAELLSI